MHILWMHEFVIHNGRSIKQKGEFLCLLTNITMKIWQIQQFVQQSDASFVCGAIIGNNDVAANSFWKGSNQLLVGAC